VLLNIAWLSEEEVLEDINLVSKFSYANIPFAQVTIAKTWSVAVVVTEHNSYSCDWIYFI
jgi:hypothetical protein